MRQKTIAVDFDGVIHSYKSGWRGSGVIPDPPNPGAILFIASLISRGYRVIIHSVRCRTFRGRRAIRKWLELELLKTQAELNLVINAYTLQTWDYPAEKNVIRWFIKQIRLAGKPAAHIYLDDRAITFEGWWPTTRIIEEFNPGESPCIQHGTGILSKEGLTHL